MLFCFKIIQTFSAGIISTKVYWRKSHPHTTSFFLSLALCPWHFAAICWFAVLLAAAFQSFVCPGFRLNNRTMQQRLHIIILYSTAVYPEMWDAAVSRETNLKNTSFFKNLFLNLYGTKSWWYVMTLQVQIVVFIILLTDAQQFLSSASTCHGKTFSASWWAAVCHGWLSNSKLVYVLVAMELCFKGGF